MPTRPTDETNSGKRLVWDWPLRLFHWVLAGAVITAWVSGRFGGFDYLTVHERAGYIVFGAILFRLIWGVVGTRYSQFREWSLTPRNIIKACGDLVKRGGAQAVGHSSLGALSTLALLIAVTAQAVTGLVMTDDIFFEGPWRSAVPSDVADTLSFIHHRCQNVVAALVVLHLSAIAFYKFRKGHRLVGPMIHGQKSAEVVEANGAIAGSRSLVGIIVIAISTALAWYLLFEMPALFGAEEETFYY
ncbi:MAG: cytochrome b/b6 domain-containing protein [Pseudomonadota bacterium]